MRRQTQLTGVSGVHYVAAYLSFLGFHAVPTTRNVQGPDLLVSTLDGSAALAIQVKTTIWAERTRGRGMAKIPHHCEWDIGWSSADLSHASLYFALVDLKEYTGLPDVYVVPSATIQAYFDGADPAVWKRARYHPLIGDIEQYKNEAGWALLSRALDAELVT